MFTICLSILAPQTLRLCPKDSWNDGAVGGAGGLVKSLFERAITDIPENGRPWMDYADFEAEQGRAFEVTFEELLLGCEGRVVCLKEE